MNKQISAVEAAILRKSGKVVLLDVREASELTICQIKGALHIPLGEIPKRYDALPKDRPIIVFCHHGMRSLNAQNFLISKDFDNILNMQGGISAWSQQVDTQVPQY